MKKEYQDYISLIIIFIQIGLGFLDILTDIDYAANSKKSSEEIKIAAIFFVAFQPFCQMVSWTYVFIRIHLMELQLEEQEMKKLCYYQNQIDRAETFWQFLKYSFRFKLIEWWQICKLLRYAPQGCFYGLIQYFKLLHVFLFFQIKKNDQITQHYESIFTKRFKKSTNRLSHNIHSALRKDTYGSSYQKTSILPLNSNLQASVNLKESDIENSLTSSHLFEKEKSQPLFNHAKTQSNQGIQNIAEVIFEKKKQEQLIEEFTQDELYQIYRQSTFLQYLSNEKIQGIIQISQIIQFIFESMPQLLIQFINNGQLGLWSGNNSGTIVPPIFCFILSLISIIISSINLVNYLLQKESLTFIYMQKILSKSEKTQQEEKLIKINDKLNTSILVVKADSLTKVSQLRKEIQENLENLNIVLPLIKVSSDSIFQDLSRISFNRIQKLKIDIHGDSIRYPMKEFANNLQSMNSIEEIDLKFNGNYFDGTDAMHLSQSLIKISNQKQLQRIEINLKENAIDQKGIEYLNQLAQVEKLVYLNALRNHSSALYVKSDDCQLDETIFEDIIASKNLQYLFIYKNIFQSDQQLKYFLNNLKNMNQLNGYQLNFSGYQMTEDILVQLKEFNQTQTQLTNIHLNLVKCGINEENLRNLYEYDGDQVRAYSINLDFNKCVRDLRIEDCKFLNKINSLEISLQGCKLQNKVELINNLSQLDSVSSLKLNISDLISETQQVINYEEFQEYELNLINYDGLRIKNLMMSDLATLNVDISYSKMNPEVIKSFVVNLKQSKKIRDLTLNFKKNYLSSDFDQILGQTLENYTELQKVSLCLKNTNRGNDIYKTLQGLSGLQQITHIDLDYSENYIDQGFFQQEQTWYQNKPNLSSIKLQFQVNSTEQDQSKLFCPIIESNSKSLLNLSLDFCYKNKVYEQDVINLLTSLQNAQNLQSLKLDLNSFQSTLYQMNIMKNTLQSLKQITNLELLMNSMRIGEKPVAVLMPPQIQHNRQPPFNQMHIQNQQNRQNPFNNQVQQQQFIQQPLNSEKMEIFGQMFDNFILQQLKLEFYGNYVGEMQTFNRFIQNLNKSNQTMKNLQLSLGYTEIANNLLKELFQAIQNMSHLDTLYLSIRYLQTEHLPIALFEKQSLLKLTLCLDQCNIQRECFIQCSQAISKMKKLKEMRIELSRAQLEDNQCVNEFSSCFNKLQGLQKIYLGMDSIKISKETIKALSENILKEKIKEFRIDMSYGYIDQDEQHVIAELLKGFNNLQRLHLKINNIGMDDQGFKQMIDEIQFMKCLSTFKLKFEGLSITQASIQILQSYLSNNTNILSKVTLINKDDQVAPQLIQMEKDLQQTTKIPYIRIEKK
ncbi:transmembrane protein, putative (macronuclear) [Tetrahymena thermophila SB210]|uniref:Transmembrane protein, putative n=1 Tax=Tetrahymena thermophila (strain SB210) TaxID=312017 RepID=Q24E63_TETTS|nr:transmembrane protein, putative [Tetrahymena thermophila SB210]EAS06038.2 transmembrane protein, putative [Tetrahymena thermophila SB210]|eukprot:XP_001026283.2 transmembrane protein, putative [Tetrahymena thermophila SB210]